MSDELPKTADELAQVRTTLAEQRTLMAADRSLMAWIRTGLSMISFGFTIYKLLEGLRSSGFESVPFGNPRNVGLFLIGLGTAALCAGLWDYRHTVAELRSHQPARNRRPAFVIAIILAVTGVGIFLSISLRVL
jgi:putative membrane protein